MSNDTQNAIVNSMEMNSEIEQLFKTVWDVIAYDILCSALDCIDRDGFLEPQGTIPTKDAAEVCCDHIPWHDSDRNKELYAHWNTLTYDSKIALGTKALGPYDSQGY